MTLETTMGLAAPRFSSDVLDGAQAIAEFLFGDPKRARRIYYLVERHDLPTFRFGSRIMARRSTLADWVANQEKQGELFQ